MVRSKGRRRTSGEPERVELDLGSVQVLVFTTERAEVREKLLMKLRADGADGNRFSGGSWAR